ERQGEIPCIIVYADRRHVDYIFNMVNPIQGFLKQKGFKVILLSEDTLPDEHFGKTVEEIIENCELGIVIFDGLRPNVIYEYGLLRGNHKPVIPLQDKKAAVAIKSYYAVHDNSDANEVRNKTGITKHQFQQLISPPVGSFSHLSDRQGVNAIRVDSGAPIGSSEHPQKKLEVELEKLMTVIIDSYSKRNLKAVHEISPDSLERYQLAISKLLRYYTRSENFGSQDIDAIIDELEMLERDSGAELSPAVLTISSSLYTSVGREKEQEDASEAATYYLKAIGLLQKVMKLEDEPVRVATAQRQIGDIYSELAKNVDRREYCGR